MVESAHAYAVSAAVNLGVILKAVITRSESRSIYQR